MGWGPALLDEAFVHQVMEALERLPRDAKPLWGRMTAGDLTGHLLATLRYSLGQISTTLPSQTAPLPGWLLRWLFLEVGMKMPKNIRFRGTRGEELPLPKVEGSIDELRIALLDVWGADVRRVPTPPPHPYLGRLTLKQWKKFHVLHIRHHLSQFGLLSG